MKVVVFAHTPPPHHGQSRLVQMMLEGFENLEMGVQCFHVNCRFSDSIEDLGRFRPMKIIRLLGYCAQAIWLRLRTGADVFYYVPAPPLRTPLFRDCIVLFLCRPLFRRTILHWHAAGLGEWISSQPLWLRRFARTALGGADLAIVMTQANAPDARVFNPKRLEIVADGIPDPCPNPSALLLERSRRVRNRQKRLEHPSTVRVLYMGLGLKEKGLFDAINGVAEAANICNREDIPLQFVLTIAGKFFDEATEKMFVDATKQIGDKVEIRRVGFVSGDEKTKLLEDSDIFCFPTYYFAESFGLVLLEAMAFGLAVVATRWRGNSEILPADYPGFVDIKAPEQIGRALIDAALRNDFEILRSRFLERFTVDEYVANLAKAFHTLDA